MGYVHLVFTMPAAARPSRAREQAHGVDLLFRAAADTLLQVAANPKRLGRRSAGSWCCTPGPATAAPSPRPLRRADGQLGAPPARGGSTPVRASSSRSRSFGNSFAASSWPASGLRIKTGASTSPGLDAAEAGGGLSRLPSSALSPALGRLPRSRPLAARPTCCTTSRATRTASPSRTTGSSTSPTTPSRFGGKTTGMGVVSGRSRSTSTTFSVASCCTSYPSASSGSALLASSPLGVGRRNLHSAVRPWPSRRPRHPNRRLPHRRGHRGRVPAVAAPCAPRAPHRTATPSYGAARRHPP